MPEADAVAAMMEYNRALQEAGVLITCDGLHPPSMGARVTFAGGKPLVTDGPFAEAKEVLGGFWMIEVASRDEAIAWASALPGRPERGDRGPPGAGDGRFPGRRAGGGAGIRDHAGPRLNGSRAKSAAGVVTIRLNFAARIWRFSQRRNRRQAGAENRDLCGRLM